MNGRREAFGGLELIGRLSSGGMGEVLLARRRGVHGFEKLVAVKTIRCDLVQRDDIRRMFLDEARLMARLDHPAITQVYDFGEHNDVLFLAMEYVPGVVLNRLLKKRGERLPESVAARIAIQVAHGLHAAHELVDSEGRSLGVVHRDVSPHNLILTFDGRVKILDFGIALFRDREAPETEHGVVKGKVSYIAPEQLKGQRADRRSDIYSLGVVLHELLTGRKLFTSTTPLQDLIERETVPAPSVVVPGLSPALDEVVMKALAFDPDKRFQDARDVALGLERSLASMSGETVEEFADRELKEERSSQRARLSSISSGQDKGPAPDSGPASLAISVESGDVLALDQASGALGSGSPVVRPVRDPATSGGDSEVDLSSVRSRTSGGPFVFVLLLAAVAAISVALLAREPEVAEQSLAEDRALARPQDRRFAAEPASRAPRAEPEAPSAVAAVATPSVSAAPAPATVGAAELAAPSPPTDPATSPPPAAQPETASASASADAKAVAKVDPPADVKSLAKADPPADAKSLAKVDPPADAKAPKASGKSESRVEPRPDVKSRPRSAYPDTPPIPSAASPSQGAPATSAGTAPRGAAARAPVVKAQAPKVTDGKKKPPASKPREPASLSVEASPNAVVLIDGKVVGFTPIAVKLEAGKHEVQVRKPYSRALRWRRTVWLRDGQKLELTAPAE